MYTTFRTRAEKVDVPTFLDCHVTGAARSMIGAPGGFGCAVMCRTSRGDIPINRGLFKRVWRGVRIPDGKHCAVGICNIAETASKTSIPQEHVRELLRREATFIRKAQVVPGVVNTPISFEYGGVYYFVMDYCKDGELFTLIEDLRTGERPPLPLATTVAMSIKMLQTVTGVHRLQIIHRDLKPENFFLIGLEPYLGDFGLATYSDDQGSFGVKRPSGTAEQLAPEILSGAAASEKTDMWSLGVTLFTLLTGELLPQQLANQHDGIVLASIPRDKNWHPKIEVPFVRQNRELTTLLSKVLEVDPKKRISAFNALNRMRSIAVALKRPDKPHTQAVLPSQLVPLRAKRLTRPASAFLPSAAKQKAQKAPVSARPTKSPPSKAV